MICVAVAQVISQLDLGGHPVAEPYEPLDNVLPWLREMTRHDPFQDRELNRSVPLNRELVVWDAAANTSQLCEQLRLVGGLNHSARIDGHVRGDGGERCRQAHLEACGRANHSLALEPRECLVR